MYIVLWRTDNDVLTENFSWSNKQSRAKLFSSNQEALNFLKEVGPHWLSQNYVMIEYRHPLNMK